MNNQDFNFKHFNIKNKDNYTLRDYEYILVEAGLSETKRKENIPYFTFKLSNGVSDNVFLEEFILVENLELDILSLVNFSFNFAKEKDIANLSKLLDKHIDLVTKACDEKDFDYLTKIINAYFNESKIGYFFDLEKDELAPEDILVYSDIFRVLKAYNKHYDGLTIVLE